MGNITVINKKKKKTYQVIYLLSLYLRLQITSQQVLSLNFKPNFKVSIIKLSLLINHETSCDKLYDLNIIKYYLKNKVQLFVEFILP